jgi:hypothetical protein
MHAFLFFLGILMIIIGIATRTAGAWLIGLIVAAVNIQLGHETSAHSL